MIYNEEDYIMLSALQHYIFCPRQCALIHIEQQWAENRFTAEGRILHERADSIKGEQKRGIRIVRTLPLCSSRLGLSGQADVVEFHNDGIVYPVEYKRGRPKIDNCDEVQLCAQALCLEEMLDINIDKGALFYGQKKRRKEVPFCAELRSLTEKICFEIHALIDNGNTPSAVYLAKCDQCSLLTLCMPKCCNSKKTVRQYIEWRLENDL